MFNKYDQLSVPMLIRSVQETAVKVRKINALDTKAKKKAIKPSALAAMLTELQGMRSSLVKRLGDLDRSKPEFFPIGSYIVYQKPSPVDHLDDFFAPDLTEKPRNGVVQKYTDTGLIVRFEGDEFSTAVYPGYVKLLFIRQN